jgi:acylphosphatase
VDAEAEHQGSAGRLLKSSEFPVPAAGLSAFAADYGREPTAGGKIVAPSGTDMAKFRSRLRGLKPIVCVRHRAEITSWMSRRRLHVFYSGRVQGVGFRFQTKSVAAGFEVTGVVRNLADGRVEVLAEGTSEELMAFHEAIRDSGLEPMIRDEQVTWSDATGEFRGFEIVR